MHNAYNDITLPCFINDFKLTLRPIAANAIISSLLLINLNIFDNSGDIILNVNSAHVIKNPITYQGIFILPFLVSVASPSRTVLLVYCFIRPTPNTTTTKNITLTFLNIVASSLTCSLTISPLATTCPTD